MKFNVLCVDELGITKPELAGMLKNLDINFINVKGEIEAINVLHEKKCEINAIVWTVNSAADEEFESLKRVKGKSMCKNIPVVIVSRFTGKKYIIRAIESGAVEYIAKPYDEETVLRKMCKVLGLSFEKTIRNNIDEDIISFSFSEMFSKEVKAASRGGHHLSIMLVSVIPEDTDIGLQEDVDEIIKLIKRVVKTRLRETDTSFHYGINNLLILLPFADKEGVKSVEKKIHDSFNTHSLIKQKNQGYKLITSSVSFPEDGKVKDKLLEKLEKGFNTHFKSKQE